MSEGAEQPESPEAGPVWCLVLEPLDKRPDGTDPGPVPERVAAAIQSAQARGMVLLGVRLAFVAAPADVPEGVRVRAWLKRCLRDQALKARWPREGGGGKAERGQRRGTPGRGRPVKST